MKNKVKTLITGLLNEFDLEFQSFEGFAFFEEQPIDIIVGTKDRVDYMIFAFIKHSFLNVVCEDIQIEIFTRLKLKIQKSEEPEFSAISRSIDKNSTLIICSQVPPNTCEIELNKTISSIEEDSYYYKKQVLSYSRLDESNIDELLAKNEGVLEECEKIVTDIEKYNSFISGNSDSKYALVALLYEKLPFLTLKIKSEDRLVLKDEILRSLSDKEVDDLAFYEDLIKKGSIEDWVNGIGAEND